MTQRFLIFGTVVLIAVLLSATPPKDVELRNILHHLNFVPLIFAGMLFGWRMALMSTVFALIVESVNLYSALETAPFEALDFFVELSIFGASSILVGLLSDRAKRQHGRLEHTAGELAHVYRELSQNVEQLKKAERLYAAGQLSASLAHEIRNPLASISGAAALLKRSYGSEDSQSGKSTECLEIIEKESHRLNKLLTNFLEFARPRAPRFRPTDIGEIIHSVLTLAAHTAGDQIELRRNVQPELPEVQCDPEQLKQVLLNLVLNAMQASSGKGVVEISASRQNGQIVILVKDEGRGLDAEQSSHIFEPFFTTKENGTGLGLAISAKIVEQHQGQLLGRNNQGPGMTFEVQLPLAHTGAK